MDTQPEADRNNPLRTFIAIFVVAVIAYQLVGHYFDTRDKPSLDAPAELRQALSDGITSITITQAVSCKENFSVSPDAPGIADFVSRARASDSQGISGHSYPIYEATLALRTGTQTLVYLASVNVHEPNDLFLRRMIDAADRNGQMRHWVYREIRVPGASNWITSRAPRGAL